MIGYGIQLLLLVLLNYQIYQAFKRKKVENKNLFLGLSSWRFLDADMQWQSHKRGKISLECHPWLLFGDLCDPWLLFVRGPCGLMSPLTSFCEGSCGFMWPQFLFVRGPVDLCHPWLLFVRGLVNWYKLDPKKVCLCDMAEILYDTEWTLINSPSAESWSGILLQRLFSPYNLWTQRGGELGILICSWTE